MVMIPQNAYADNFVTIDSASATTNSITVQFTAETEVFTTKILVLISTQGGPEFIAEEIKVVKEEFSETITTEITTINGEPLQEDTTYDIKIEVKIVNRGKVVNPMAYASVTTESNGTTESTPESIIQQVVFNDGCSDCTPPTLGYDDYGIKKVDNGICINNSCMDGGYYHTDYPMQKTLLYYPNTISTVYYENNSPHNIELVQLGIGVTEIGSTISESEAVIEVYINNFANDIYNPTIKETRLIDPQGIIERFTSGVELVQCMEDITELCLKTNFMYSYAKAPTSTILMSNAMDYNRNSINNYFNDGLKVIHYTPPTPVVIQEEPEECIISIGQNRNNPCQFLPIVEYEKQRAAKIMQELVPIYR